MAASEPMTIEQMSESDEYLRALIEQHSVTLNGAGQHCAICFTRVPCDITSLAASGLHRSALLAERDAEIARLREAWNRAGDLLPYTVHVATCDHYDKGPGNCSCGLLDVIRDYGRAALAARGGAS